MGSGRTKQTGEDQSKRHSTAMDCYFMKVNSSEESVRCIAVKEGRHQNMMSSVALKKGVKETWAIERGVRFIGLLGYREITWTRSQQSLRSEAVWQKCAKQTSQQRMQ